MGTCISMAKETAEGHGEDKMATQLDSKKRLSKETSIILSQMKDIPIIQLCNNEQKIKIASNLKNVSFKKGDLLMKQGEIGNEFFLLKSGKCVVKINGKKVSSLSALDYCGEQAFLTSECERTATVEALTETECLVMDKTQFDCIVRNSSIHFVNRKNVNKKERNVKFALSNDFNDLKSETQSERQESNIDNGISVLELENTDEIVEWLYKCVKSNILFANVEKDIMISMINTMYLRETRMNTDIITQGNRNGNEFYVIKNGTFTIEKDGIQVDTITSGSCVGELALLYNAPRNASVISKKHGSIFVLNRCNYRECMINGKKKDMKMKSSFLRKVALLSSLSNHEISMLSSTLQREYCKKGDIIFKRGDIGDKFYLIMQGCINGFTIVNNCKKYFELKKGEYFGELALQYDKPRSATLSCMTDCIFLITKRCDFNDLFGNLDKIMSRQIEEYNTIKQSSFEFRNKYLIQRSLCDFEKGLLIGKGKYGSVSLVKDNRNNKIYALKAISKEWIFECKRLKQSKRRIDSLFNERNVMKQISSIDCPFLIKLICTFKDSLNVYYLMSVGIGGDMFNILKKRGYICENSAKFYIACVIEAIDTLHNEHKMIHRDLKPENIVIDNNGYALVTDFGFCKDMSKIYKTYTLCGTPGYIAPEVLLGSGYHNSADVFSIGCVLYDMLTGGPPFQASDSESSHCDQFTMIRSMMKNELKLPMYLSFYAKDLIMQLLRIKPMKRLGFINVKCIKKHKWFDGFSFNDLRKHKLKAPIEPFFDPLLMKKYNGMDPENFDTTGLDQHIIINERKPRSKESIHPRLRNWDIEF